MKFESMILGVLFAACFGICVLAMGAMLTATSTPVQMTGTSAPASSVAAAHGHCTAQTEAVRCPGNKAGNNG